LKPEDIHSTFTALIREHERMLYKVCFMYADNVTYRQDLYQEIVLQAWKGYKGFRGDAKFSTWLYQVAINTAIAGFRKDKKSVLTHTADGSLPDMPDTGTDTEQLELLHTAIATLNEIEKAIVMLYLDDKSYDEMQEIMGIPNGALRVKMTRIKEKLRQITKNN
jgi:RNA polymerase sigma-70 factor (ECF subfamily)